MACEVWGRQNTLAGSTTTYLYNALGQRVKKSGGVAGTVLMVYDESGHLLGEYNGTGGLVQETVWLGDIPVATLRPGTPVAINYVHTNHLNTPVAVTRPSDNKLRWQWHPDAFGVGAPNENPQSLGAFKYNLRLPGQYYDQETGQYYNYYRDYDPQVGRYIESDPIGIDAGVNTYAYVKNSPVRYFDSLGLDAQMCARPFYPLPSVISRHCFLRFNGNNNDTISFDNKGVHRDPAPGWWPKSCSATEGKQDDDCLKREMKKCKAEQYDVVGFNCCHCAEQAMKACGQSVPVRTWPNWPINPGPQPGEKADAKP